MNTTSTSSPRSSRSEFSFIKTLLCWTILASLARAEESDAPQATVETRGEHPVTQIDTADLEQRFTRLFQATMRAAAAQHPEVTFWSTEDTLGAHVIRSGRFREFFVSETPASRSIWFRDTAGPDGEFPRCRLVYRSSRNEPAGVVSQGFYLGKGQPVHAPAPAALAAWREDCDFWLGVLHEAAGPHLADSGR